MASGDLGIRIRRARERRGWTQQELAANLARQQQRPVGVRSVGRWERGEAVPRNAIGALEEVLGVDLTADGQPDVYPDPDEAAIWSLTRYSPAERRAMIAALRDQRRAAS
jgi:ribosome-binding protein aMBF1 (putative translation factor)